MPGAITEELRLRCLDAVVGEGRRFGVLAAEPAAGRTPCDGGWAAPVHWIPGWTARDLVRHLVTVHRWAALRCRQLLRPRGRPRAVTVAGDATAESLLRGR